MATRVTNSEIADKLRQVGDLLDIAGANPFKVRAYRNAAATVSRHATPMRQLVDDGRDLTELSDIGNDMAEYIEELVETGELSRLRDLAGDVPLSLTELLALPQVGPKRVKKLWQELDIETLDDLEDAAEQGEIAKLDGFGEKTQQHMLEAVRSRREREDRTKYADAEQHVAVLEEYMNDCDAVERLLVAGSFRRRRETVGDLDLLVTAENNEAVIDHFTANERVAEVRSAGGTRATVILDSGLQVDLRVLPERSFGAAVVYFTGSKAHNISLRERAGKKGWRLSEYGLFDVDGDADSDDPQAGAYLAGGTEEEVYEALDLPLIPPELRENRGEIEAAENDRLPDLIDVGDIRGDLQMHTDWSDGETDIASMVDACAERGYEYLAITDHTRGLAMTGGLDPDKLQRQWDAMDKVMDGRDDIRLLRALEVDIKKDGSLDLGDEWLEKLDLVIVSVHSAFDLDEDEQTKRVVRALEHPCADILAHPTGRLLQQREPLSLDLDAVFAAAAANNVAVECNGQPDRLDLNDAHLLLAREHDLAIVIDTDAHRPAALDWIRYGVYQARRAWLTAGDVLNTRSANDLLAALSTD